MATPLEKFDAALLSAKRLGAEFAGFKPGGDMTRRLDGITFDRINDRISFDVALGVKLTPKQEERCAAYFKKLIDDAVVRVIAGVESFQQLQRTFGEGVETTSCPKMGARQWTCSPTECICHLGPRMRAQICGEIE